MTREVTLLAVDPRYPEIAEIMADWTARGLLRRSVWIDQDTLRAGVDVTEAKVRVLEEATDPLLKPFSDVFGDAEIDRVRLVAVRPVHGSQPDPAPLGGLAEFTERMRSRMLAPDTPLIRINLLVPDGQATTSPEALAPTWTWNAVVSPEDRPHERAVNHGFARREKFQAHAAMAAATVAALWLHTREGALDDYDDQNVEEYGRLVVVRPSIRLALGSHVPERVIQRLVHVGITSLLPSLVDQHRNIATNEAERVEALFKAFLPTASYAMDFRPQRRSTPVPAPIGGPSLRELWRAFGDFTRMRIDNLLQRSRDSTADVVDRWLAGLPRDVDLDPTFDLTLPPTPWEIHQLAIGVPELLPDKVREEKDLWVALRHLCFSLMDAGTLPKAVADAAGELAPTLTDPHSIVRPPGEGFDLTEDERKAFRSAHYGATDVRAADFNAAAHLGAQLRAARLTDGLSDTVRASLDDCEARFDDWRNRRHTGSLLGRMAEHVSDELAKARAELREHKRLIDELDAQVVQSRVAIDQHHAKMRLRGKLTWTGLGGSAAGAALLIVPGLTSAAWFAPALLITVLAAVAGLGGTALRLMVHLAAGTRLTRQLSIVQQKRLSVRDAVRRWPEEADRLASVYEILTDWAEIIGHMLHETFGPTNETDHPDDINRSTLPEAFQVGISGGSDKHIDTLLRRTAKDCFGRGWLTRLYQELDESVRQRVGLDGNDADPDLSPAVDMYATEDPWLYADRPISPGAAAEPGPYDKAFPKWHARRRLLSEFQDGVCAEEAKALTAERIRAALATYPPEALMPTVEIGRIGGWQEEVPTRDFLAGALPRPNGDEPCTPLLTEGFSSDGLLADKTRVAKVWLWHPAAMSFDASRHPGTEFRADDDPRRRPDVMPVSRLDVSTRCHPEHLRLFVDGND